MFPALRCCRQKQTDDWWARAASSHPDILATSGRAVAYKGHTRDQTPVKIQKSRWRQKRQRRHFKTTMGQQLGIKCPYVFCCCLFLFVFFWFTFLWGKVAEELNIYIKRGKQGTVRQLQMFGRCGAASQISSCVFAFSFSSRHSLWPKGLGGEGQFVLTFWRQERPEMAIISPSIFFSKTFLNFENEGLSKIRNSLSSWEEFPHLCTMLNVSWVYIGLSYFFTLSASIHDVDLNIWFVMTLDIWELLFMSMADEER